jgi:hypothetical protein
MNQTIEISITEKALLDAVIENATLRLERARVVTTVDYMKMACEDAIAETIAETKKEAEARYEKLLELMTRPAPAPAKKAPAKKVAAKKV